MEYVNKSNLSNKNNLVNPKKNVLILHFVLIKELFGKKTTKFHYILKQSTKWNYFHHNLNKSTKFISLYMLLQTKIWLVKKQKYCTTYYIIFLSVW